MSNISRKRVSARYLALLTATCCALGTATAPTSVLPMAVAQDNQDSQEITPAANFSTLTLENFNEKNVEIQNDALGGKVTVTYDSAKNRFTISGDGTIDKAKWNLFKKDQNGRVNTDSSTPEAQTLYRKINRLVGSNERNYSIKITNGVKLPADSSELFREGRIKIIFPENYAEETKNLQNMRGIFESYSGGAFGFALDVSTWDTSKVTDMSYAFRGTWSNPDVSRWNTSQVRTLKSMFQGSSQVRPNVGSWDTSNVTDMSYTFANMGVDVSVNVGNWKTGKVTTMRGMFKDSEHANPDVSSWDTSQVTDMAEMFSG